MLKPIFSPSQLVVAELKDKIANSHYFQIKLMLMNKLRGLRTGRGCRNDRDTADTAEICWRHSGQRAFPVVPRAGSKKLSCGFYTATLAYRASLHWLNRHQWFDGSTQTYEGIAVSHLAT